MRLLVTDPAVLGIDGRQRRAPRKALRLLDVVEVRLLHPVASAKGAKEGIATSVLNCAAIKAGSRQGRAPRKALRPSSRRRQPPRNVPGRRQRRAPRKALRLRRIDPAHVAGLERRQRRAPRKALRLRSRREGLGQDPQDRVSERRQGRHCDEAAIDITSHVLSGRRQRRAPRKALRLVRCANLQARALERQRRAPRKALRLLVQEPADLVRQEGQRARQRRAPTKALRPVGVGALVHRDHPVRLDEGRQPRHCDSKAKSATSVRRAASAKGAKEGIATRTRCGRCRCGPVRASAKGANQGIATPSSW